MAPPDSYSRMSGARPTDSLLSYTASTFARELRPRPISGMSSHAGSSGVDMPLVPPEFAGPHSDTQPENLDFPSPERHSVASDAAPVESLAVVSSRGDLGHATIEKGSAGGESPVREIEHDACGNFAFVRPGNKAPRNVWH
jgi:hypothetical protein